MATLSMDATRIIGELDANHAANTAAGYGSPALDAFHQLTIRMVSESPDPRATVRAIADLLGDRIAKRIRPVGGDR
ncbi:hypothetical protein ABZ235_38800 [Streptomyces canus]|uniref:hypothetical protein n=1 Tax=Streptomyces canus TaxID=58343 RepID=UPI0033A5C94A